MTTSEAEEARRVPPQQSPCRREGIIAVANSSSPQAFVTATKRDSNAITSLTKAVKDLPTSSVLKKAIKSIVKTLKIVPPPCSPQLTYPSAWPAWSPRESLPLPPPHYLTTPARPSRPSRQGRQGRPRRAQRQGRKGWGARAGRRAWEGVCARREGECDVEQESCAELQRQCGQGQGQVKNVLCDAAACFRTTMLHFCYGQSSLTSHHTHKRARYLRTCFSTP